MFEDGHLIPNSVVVFHLGQIYELLQSWEGKGMLFFYLDMARSGYTHSVHFKKQNVERFHEIFLEAGIIVRTNKTGFRLVDSFERVLLETDKQNNLYSKLYQNILHQKRVSFKLTLILSQYSSSTNKIMWVHKDGTKVEVSKTIVDFINSLNST